MKTTVSEPKVNVLYNLLKEGVQAVYSSDNWKSFLQFQASFHNYSFGNMILVYIQCPDATRIAGFEDWKKLGRFVKRGETAIKIMAPHYKVEKDEKTGEKTRKLSGFHQTSVFDVSQTAGADLPELVRDLEGDSDALRSFYANSKSICPFPVEEVTRLDGGARGQFDHETLTISIRKNMSVKQKAKTLIHELAHGMIHRLDDPRRQSLTRNDREIEAEGTAFVVLSYFGFDTSEYSFPYVAGWNGTVDIEAIQRAGDTIQKTAAEIINKLDSEMKKQTQVA